MTSMKDPRRAYGAGEMPRDLAKLFLEQLKQDSSEYQLSKDDRSFRQEQAQREGSKPPVISNER
jgi:hypothetical protein